MTTLLSLCGVRAQAADPRTGGEIPVRQDTPTEHHQPWCGLSSCRGICHCCADMRRDASPWTRNPERGHDGGGLRHQATPPSRPPVISLLFTRKPSDERWHHVNGHHQSHGTTSLSFLMASRSGGLSSQIRVSPPSPAGARRQVPEPHAQVSVSASKAPLTFLQGAFSLDLAETLGRRPPRG